MRAILVAAGMGTRLRPLTNTIPKSLVEINGISLLERQIINLKEIGIDEIVVLTGYLHEKFDNLVEKYNLVKIVNDKYDVYNNIYTMYLAKDYLQDTFVIDADNYINNNFLPKVRPEHSEYYSACKENIDGEWLLIYDENNKLQRVDIGKEGGKPSYIMSGASYWSERDGKIIAQKIDKKVNGGDFENLYWDDIVVENLKDLDVYVNKIGSNDIFEIDSLKDLEYLKNKLSIR
ncbi:MULTISPECIES: sugar phosphate nucleotidyltransferase [Clostridium]|uniref:sugar phosphate nucleotidyltransferase n=1 Tax=Clostridium TaxID=1485 RepID=UPI0013CB7FB2|nr:MULTISPECIES: sugar phosphate nucleotidyltransferase [Clostridium]MBN1043324.1 CTP--phosphocholine cytidylyltransferase [Clostridium botulinum]MBY6837765.1 NTP transferase domain-containing protein [Clostridium botulinum]MBY6915043.1 NTP transferase domain-containing protein [Clostridium botulinum]MBY7025399.1 NTP transferase domain-containing protein [Clostridium botulinum]NFE74187.1 CTP--phosphocholine cytidylyltransferase [Clostridium botulinum]